MRLNVRASGTYELSAESFLMLMVEPPLHGVSHVLRSEQLVTTPTQFCALRHDLYGNNQRHIIAPAGNFRFDYSAEIEIRTNTEIPHDAAEHLASEIPNDVMVYTLPSRYCQSDLLSRMAISEFGQIPSGGGRVRAIREWVRSHVEYRYGTTDSMTSAFDTATERVGVCRDFAHLVIAFCRALCIPARYVSGYALGLDPPDFHGFAQVYLGGDWHNVDATFDGLRPALVPIAVGRDASDVAITTFWSRYRYLEQTVEVSEVSSEPFPLPLSA